MNTSVKDPEGADSSAIKKDLQKTEDLFSVGTLLFTCSAVSGFAKFSEASNILSIIFCYATSL